jgi:hypothetical protein
MCQRSGTASSGQDEVFHLRQFAVQAVDLPFDTFDAFGGYLALDLQFGCFLVGCQVRTDGEQFMLYEREEIDVGLIVQGCDKQSDE